MQLRSTSNKSGRRATAGGLAVVAIVAAAVTFPTAAIGRARYPGASYKVVYAGSGRYKKQTSDGPHSGSLSESFHWQVNYIISLSTKPRSIVAGPLVSGTGGGTWTYESFLSTRGGTLSCSGNGTLKPAFAWNIEPSGGMITGKTETSGSADLLVAVVQSGGPFKASGTQKGNYCQPNAAADAAAGLWGGDVFGANVHLPKKLIGKRQIIDKVSSATENLKNPGEIPAGMVWTGTVTFQKS